MKILSKPKGNAEEYGRWSVNPYIGCPHGCLYCYLKSGSSGGYLGQPKAVLKKGIVSEDHAYHLAMAEILENREQIIRDGGLFMSFTSDPCIPETSTLFLSIARGAEHYNIPVTLLTKSGINTPFGHSFSDPTEEGRNLQWTLLSQLVLLEGEKAAIGFTLTGHDNLEPNAAPNSERIELMERLLSWSSHVPNVKIWASIEPVIDFDSRFRMIQQAVDAGCEHFKIGLMTKNTKVCRKGFALGGKTFEPYDPVRSLAFVQDVMQATRGRATVYWKQSFREFIGGTEKHRLCSNDDLHRIFDDYPNAVGKDWSIFAPSPTAPSVQ
jgi:DNA repair photolyase